ncbi:hypothetical protein F4561_004121 [Lipingzhangella halophila]|uniref:Uncharacterized protein n=1 Tax=Lipingzhangella halophila TaxID=1783352 RepID=A0A7W7W406_9ACTN|nr:hypothetical protein [Lipingzhangella halophila]MBB4933301.1 hypothetical protein [Lipingzhangella halophila]
MAELFTRLSGGVAASATPVRDSPPYDPGVVLRRLDTPLRRLWALDSPKRDGSLGRDTAEVEAAIDELCRHLADNGDGASSGRRIDDERAEWQIRELVQAPQALLERSVALDQEGSAREHWARACLAAEAVWRHLAAAGQEHPGLRRLRPLGARMRFLLLAEPFRYRGTGLAPWTPSPLDADYGAAHGAVGVVFGSGTEYVLVERVRAARQEWLAYLDAYQSHPVLAQAPPGDVEVELRELAAARGYRSGPLVLSPNSLDRLDRPGGGDLAAAREVVERHLLPRFRIGAVALLAFAPVAVRGVGRVAVLRRCGERLRYALAALSVVGVVAALWLAFVTRDFPAAAVVGALVYTAIGAGTVLFGTLWSAPWLLRVPAATAVGLVPLIAFPDWWQHVRIDWPLPPVQWAPLAVPVVAAYGYLVVEGRNHGVGEAAALLRALGITGVAAAHAPLVCLVGMVGVAPVFTVPHGPGSLAAVWVGDSGDPIAVLLVSSGWCLAVGVFSQILWEDRPVTAPLAHLRWRADG